MVRIIYICGSRPTFRTQYSRKNITAFYLKLKLPCQVIQSVVIKLAGYWSATLLAAIFWILISGWLQPKLLRAKKTDLELSLPVLPLQQVPLKNPN